MKQTAGILLYQYCKGKFKFFLIHHGHPASVGKDKGAWSIPKGKILLDENPFDAAKREFYEETGHELKEEEYLELTPMVNHKRGKILYSWAHKDNLHPRTVKSKIVETEWPNKSGQIQTHLEIDDCGWFDYETAKWKIQPGQLKLMEELIAKLQ